MKIMFNYAYRDRNLNLIEKLTKDIVKYGYDLDFSIIKNEFNEKQIIRNKGYKNKKSINLENDLKERMSKISKKKSIGNLPLVIVSKSSDLKSLYYYYF